MITTVTQPAPITFARNQNVYKVRVTDAGGFAYRAFGSRAYFTATSANCLGVGQSFTVSYKDPDTLATETITFSVTGIISPENLPLGSGPADASYIEEVFSVIKAHPLLAPFFSFQTYYVGAATTLFIEALDRTFDYELELDISGISASGWAQLSNQAPAESTAPENLAARFDILFERSYKAGGWTKVASMTVTPDDQGFAAIDLESILNSEFYHARYVNPDGTRRAIIDDVLTNTPFIADNRRRYMIRAGEQQGSPITILEWLTSDALSCIDGGVTMRAWGQGAYLSGLTGSNSLATWRTRKQRWVSPRQPAFLSWYNSQFTGTVQLKVQEVQGDGTAGANTLRQSLAVELGDTVTFAVGAEALGLLDTTRMYTCQILLADETTATLQATCVYYIDRRYHEPLRFLLWRNSWGVAEELRCTGHYTQQTEVARASATRSRVLEYSAQDQERVQYDVQEQRTGIYRTGYISRDEVIALQDMHRINDVWEVQPDGSLLALDILSNSMRVYDTRDELFAVEFEATHRLALHNHAPGYNADNHSNQNNVLPTFGGPWIDNDGVGAGNWTGVGGSWNYGG